MPLFLCSRNAFCMLLRRFWTNQVTVTTLTTYGYFIPAFAPSLSHPLSFLTAALWDHLSNYLHTSPCFRLWCVVFCLVLFWWEITQARTLSVLSLSEPHLFLFGTIQLFPFLTYRLSSGSSFAFPRFQLQL